MNNILEVKNLTSGYGRSNIIRDLSFSMKENIGIFGSIVSAFFISGLLNFFLFLGAGWLIGSFVYERALNYVYCGSIWDSKKTEYHIMGFVFPRRQWQDYIVVGVGVILLILRVFSVEHCNKVLAQIAQY